LDSMKIKRKQIATLAILIIITLVFHLFSHIWRVGPGHSNVLKHVLADICYIPIFIGALWFGIRGAVISSTVIAIFSFIFVLLFPPVVRSELRSDYIEIIFFVLAGGISGIVLDKDRQLHKILEETQRRAAIYNRSLLEAALDPLVTIGPDGKITDVNAATELATGYSRNELIGTDFSDYFTEQHKAFRGYKKVFDEGTVHDYPLEIRHRDGHITPVLYNASLYRDEAGKVIGIFAAARDITERKKADETVKTERQRLYNVLETLPAYVALLTADYHIPFANRTFRERFGDSNGKRCYDFLFNRDDPCPDCETYKVLKTNAPLNWGWTGPDGRNYDIYDYPFKESDGSPMILEMGIDITERKQAEAKLRLQQEKLQLQNEELQAAEEEMQRQNEELRVAYEEIKAAEENVSRINRIYSVLSAINEAIVRITDVDQLYKTSCHIAVNEGGLRMAWIGLTNEKTGMVEAVASDGVIDGYLNDVKIASGPDIFGKGPTGTSIRENRHIVCENIETDPHMIPWRKEALKRGYRSSAAFPLRLGSKVIGAFTLYSSDLNFFNAEQVNLLSSLSNDLSFAIESIEKERLQIKAEEALRESEKRFRGLFETMITAYAHLEMIYDESGEPVDSRFLDVNPAWEKMMGLTRDQAVGKTTMEIFPNLEPYWIETYAKVVATGQPVNFENYLSDTDKYYAVYAFRPSPGQYAVNFLDVTERKKAELRILANNTLLRLSDQASSKTEFLEQASKLIQEWVECSAVGIRILDDSSNIPYAAFTGLNKEFWEKENQLSIATHQCLCIRAITQESHPWEKSNITAHGSFFTNDSMKFIGNLSQEEKARYRGICIDFGYRSLAVTPIKYRGDIIGVIHYIDKRPDRFPSATVEFIESISGLIGESIYKFTVEDELKANYEALRLASSYNRSLLEASLDPLVTIGPNGKITDINAATEAVTGCSRSELIGTDFSDYFTEPERARTGYQRVFRDGFVKDYPLEIRHKDDYVTAVLYNASLYRDEAGKVIGIFAAARDITERQKLEDALWRTNELLESMFSAIDMHIAYLDKDFNFIRVNRAYAETCGYPIDFFPGKNHFTLYPNAENESIFRDVVKTGKPFSVTAKPFEFPDHPERGVTFWDWSLDPILEPDGSVGGLVFSLIDVTQRERAAREISLKNAALAAVNAELQQFAYVASHDLQEPLRMISSYLQLIEKRYRDRIDSDANEFIDFAVDGAKRLQNMINSLLVYSRVGTQGVAPKKESAKDALDHAMANLMVAIDESKAKVTADELPEVYADINQLIQIFQNLIGNSIKFRGSKRPRIKISAEPFEGRWLFKIKDNGIGIDKEYWGKIFNIFHRLHGPEYPGTGIGLALCKRIVERHGGDIWLESEPGTGTTFYFTLPMKPEI
jgi:PAS domain S-box-containing protein